jgi:hypothetical protein
MSDAYGFAWAAIPLAARDNFYKAVNEKYGVLITSNFNAELEPYHAEIRDGWVIFADMKYYNLFLLRWS